jgi:hypothetical protein
MMAEWEFKKRPTVKTASLQLKQIADGSISLPLTGRLTLWQKNPNSIMTLSCQIICL